MPFSCQPTTWPHGRSSSAPLSSQELCSASSELSELGPGGASESAAHRGSGAMDPGASKLRLEANDTWSEQEADTRGVAAWELLLEAHEVSDSS